MCHLPVCFGAPFALFTLSLLNPNIGYSATELPREIAPIAAPFPMPQLQRPNFPSRSVSILDFGAVPGGVVDNTGAIARSIESCAKAGGGHVVVPAGKWLTGPIHLQSNIDLHFEKDAELIFSDRFEDYLPPVLVRNGGIDLYNYSPLIYARDATNIAITGPGTLNGNAKAWWQFKGQNGSGEAVKMAANGVPVDKRIFGTPDAAIRPNFVCFLHCSNVLWEGFTIGSGPAWTLHPVYCENVIVRDVHVETHGPNNDGLDPDSSRNVLIENCSFQTGDDCIVLKSGYNQDGWRVNKPTENVVIRNCSATQGHGGLVIGSEMSGGVRNIYMHDCSFDGTDRVVRIKSRADRGGFVENVWVDHVEAKHIQDEAVVLNMNYGADKSQILQTKPPVFRDMEFNDITVNEAACAVSVSGLADSPAENIRFLNLSIHAEKGVVVKDAKSIRFSHVDITPVEGPVFALDNVVGVVIDGGAPTLSKSDFLKIDGSNSTGITVENTNPSESTHSVSFGQDVPKSAVTFK